MELGVVALAVALTGCDWGMAPPPASALQSSPVVDVIPSLDDQSIASLGESIRELTSNPTMRVRALYDWVALHIAYDVAAMRVPSAEDTDPRRVFARRKGVCEGYARLLVELGHAADIDVRMVSGDTPRGPLAWNEVSLNGVLKPIDVTWDAGYVDAAGHFHRQYSAEYFLTDRSTFDRDHTATIRAAPAYEHDPGTMQGDVAPDRAAFQRACDAGIKGACYEVEWLNRMPSR